MKINLAILSIVFLFLSSLNAQNSFMVADGLAVFIPGQQDVGREFPSFTVTKDLVPQCALPNNWRLIPAFSKENGKAVIRIAYDGSVDFYGTGEVKGDLKRNDKKVTLWNTDNYIYNTVDEGKRLYQSHPWVLGVRRDGTAFGILADNSQRQDIDISNPIVFSSDGSFPRVIVIEKKNPQEVLKTLAELTGKMQLPPLWALGYQQSKFTYTPETKVMEIANEFRRRKIPADVIWMDIDYMEKYKVFTFNNEKFPNTKGMNDDLHSKNFKVVYMIDPGVKKEKGYIIYESGTNENVWVKDKNGLDFIGKVWPGDCVFPDFTRPETQKWWAGLYKNFMATGIDGIWNDMNEPSVFDGPGGTMPVDNIHRGGGNLPAGTHAMYHNVYGMLMVKSSLDGIKNANPNKRPFILSRSNFLGGQKYAATWTGDNKSSWEYLKMSIPMCINLSLSGQPFNGPDIGGFEGDCTADLLGHWIAIGAYYPFCRNHTSNNTVDQEPWAFGKEIENVSRTALNRRYILMPYLYSSFREASISGAPIMQPVFFADLTDSLLRDEQQAFLLGNDLMIVPRWAINVKMPKQNWKLIPFEKNDDGYQAHVYLRPGAVLPIGKVIQSTVDYRADSITLYINPTEKGLAFGSLYDDRGEGYGYKAGEFSVSKFSVSKENTQKLKINITKQEGKLSIKRVYRIAFMKGTNVIFSNWSDKQTQYLNIPN